MLKYPMDKMLKHLRDRFLLLEYYSEVVVTDDFVTFPLWNFSGQMTGYQVYNPSLPKKALDPKDPRTAKYFTYCTEGKDPVWGLETVEWNTKTLFVCEGIFDAARLHFYGFAAIAVLGNNPRHLASWLRAQNCDTVACCQGDKAGVMLALHTKRAVFLPEGEDVSSLDHSQFIKAFKEWVA